MRISDWSSDVCSSDLDRHDYDTSSVKSVAFGGSPSAEELQRKIRETFPNVTTTSNAYGLTETSSVATVISGDDAVAKPTSVGPPVPTVKVQIDRKSVVKGKSVSVRVDLGGRRLMTKKKKKIQNVTLKT